MSIITERITEVIREHCWADGFTSNCACKDEAVWTHTDHATHVAEAIQNALNLTEELLYPTSWTHPHPGPKRRYVTPWTENQ